MAGNLDLKRYLGPTLSNEQPALYNDGGDTYVEFGTIDSAAFISGNYPVGRPTDVDSAFSYEVWLRLVCTKAPDNKIDNIRFWGTGDNPAGIVMHVGTATDSSTGSIITPRMTVSSVATFSVTDYSAVDDSMVWSEGSITEIDSASAFLCMQVHVTPDAAQGDESGSDLIFHFSFDEA